MAHLDKLGVPYSPRPGVKTGESGSSFGRRDYSSACYTYIHDPDGNMIELVHHPLGVADSEGNQVELLHDPKSLRWATLPGFGSST